MKIKIVDNSDNEIGLKDRDKVDYGCDIYRVSALWITNLKEQVLLAKRALTKDKDPGRWGPAVAGTIDEGESYDENIYKEAMEEIGLENEKFTKGPKVHITYPRNYFCQWYFVKLDREIESFTMQEEEVCDLAWIDVEQLKNELKSNPDKYVLAMPQIVKELGL